MNLIQRFKDKSFLAIFGLCLFGGLIFTVNAVTNVDVIKIEQQHANGLPVQWLCFLAILVSILVAIMTYIPYKRDKTRTIFNALILYEVMFIFWSTTLFHTRSNRATATLTGMVFIVTTLWLGWACYHLDKNSIWMFIIALIWAVYMQNYTLGVDAHPWIAK
jgi:tryptophan-rich sensory protein